MKLSRTIKIQKERNTMNAPSRRKCNNCKFGQWDTEDSTRECTNCILFSNYEVNGYYEKEEEEEAKEGEA